MTVYTYTNSPLGQLLLVSDGQNLTGLYIEDQRYGVAIREDWRRDDLTAPFRLAQDELEAYFAGELQIFSVPLALHGTPFQRRVWAALQAIPYGQTIAYRELARRIGRPQAARAVGAANARNPVAIIVPCHRVIGSGGGLTGYGGGLNRKEALLALEKQNKSISLVQWPGRTPRIPG